MENLLQDWNNKFHIAKEKVICSSKPMSKLLPDGSHFFGIVNIITGDPIKGVQTTSAGEVYEGFFEPGVVRSGDCIVEDKSDDRKFIGTYKDGLPMRGTLVTMGFTFDGEFENGMFVRGKLAHADGMIYEGEFEHNVEHHEGIYRQYHGAGKLIHSDGSSYTGEFVQGNEHGIGSYTQPDGYSYSGVYSQGVKSGEGIEKLPSGEIYIGQFHNNLRHGHGVLSSADGRSVVEGPFRANKPTDGKWEITYHQSSKLKKYTGFAKNLLPHSNGTMIYLNGDCYNGQFRDGERHGQGICVFVDGETYEGSWIRDIPQGLEMFEHDFLQNTGNEDDELCPECDNQGSTCETPNASLIEINFRNEINGNSLDPDELSDKWGSSDLKTVLSQSFHSCFRKIESPISDFGKDNPNYKSLPLKYYGNGDKYYGCIDSKGHRQGFGRYVEHCSSSTYEGLWKDNFRQGQGILICGNAKYFGNFFDDCRHGEGTLILNDASSYQGQFKNGFYHGSGILCSSDGTTYSGEWFNGKKKGRGELYFPDGKIYVGEFQGDNRHGEGVLYLDEKRNRIIYDGWWKFNLRDGEGMYNLVEHELSTDQDYVCFKGSFVRDQLNGHGILSCPNGCAVEGFWLRDNAVSGHWKVIFGDGSSFEGEAVYQNDSTLKSFSHLELPLPNGYGTMTYQDGSVYSGYFINGSREGCGTCTFSNGERWEGAWTNDSIDMNGKGKGKLTLADGTIHHF